MNDIEFESQLREHIRTVARTTEVPVGLHGRLVRAAQSTTTPRAAHWLPRPHTWLLPLVAAILVAGVTVPLVLLSASSGRRPALSPSPSPTTQAVLPAPIPTTSVLPSPTTSRPTPSATRSRTPSPSASVSTTPAALPIGAGGECGYSRNLLGASGPVMVRTGRTLCAPVMSMLATYSTTSAGQAKQPDLVGPTRVGDWTCQSDTSYGLDSGAWTVCTSAAATISVGQNAPTPWLPFDPHNAGAQFYYDQTEIIRAYTTEAGFGSGICRTGDAAQWTPQGSPTLASQGLAVSVRDVRASGRIVYGDVVVTNVSSAPVTFWETLSIAADGLLRSGSPVTPVGGWGVGLDDRMIRLAPGASTDAVHELPAFTCAGNALPAGTYTAGFYVILDVHGTTVPYAASNQPPVTLR